MLAVKTNLQTTIIQRTYVHFLVKDNNNEASIYKLRYKSKKSAWSTSKGCAE